MHLRNSFASTANRFASRRRPARGAYPAKTRLVLEHLEDRTLLDVGPDGFGYTASAHSFESLEILGQPGTFTVINLADDVSVPVDLGTNTSTFYGHTYTGHNQLFASSNGLITFGSANSDATNANLQFSPPQAAIAPLWNDWIKTSGTPMLLGRFDQVDAGGTPHRLVLEWNQVRHFNYSGTLTFQAFLSLNTGPSSGDVILNYPILQSGDIWAEGKDSTVGIKDAGSQGPNRLLVNYQGLSPFVGTGKAILITNATAGPFVTASTPSGNIFSPLTSATVTFDREIDISSFTTSQVRFTGPSDPLRVTGVSVVPNSGNRQFKITFANLPVLGNYTMVIGPNIRDLAGHQMDQNHNGIPGEIPGDQYTAQFTLQGPKITASTPFGTLFGPVDHVRVTFNEPMDASTLTRDKIFVFLGPKGLIPITAVMPVAGSMNTQFDITFAPQQSTGSYTMLIGPDIRDLGGHRMDQDGNFIEGEFPGDLYAAQFGILGPRIVSATPNTTSGPVFSVRVTFNETMDPATFTPDKIASFTGPNGDISVSAVVPVAASNFTQFDIVFAPQTTTGHYAMLIGPDIRDQLSNQMDQDNNLIPGEIPDDRFLLQFNVPGPRITASTPSGTAGFGPVDHVRVTFNSQMDVSSFTPEKVVSFTGPDGNIPIADVFVVPFTNNTQFDITVEPQDVAGTYVMVIGPNIRDSYGNQMDQDQNSIPGEVPGDQYTAQFTIISTTLGPDGFGTTASTHPFESLEILGQPDTFTVINFADDVSVPVDLGSNTFTFYGHTYTGQNQLFASSNGLITFGSANSDATNANLQSSPPQAAIAPLWNDWIKTSGTPMLLGRFDQVDAGGTPHRLVLEWNQVRHFNYSGTLTFQAFLSLNTGPNSGDIILSYLILQSGDVWAEGNDSTVGIKDTGSQGPNRLLVNYQGLSPFVGSGQAILFHKEPEGGGGGDSMAPTRLRTAVFGTGAPLLFGGGDLGAALATPLTSLPSLPLTAPPSAATPPTRLLVPSDVASADRLFAALAGEFQWVAVSRRQVSRLALADDWLWESV